MKPIKEWTQVDVGVWLMECGFEETDVENFDDQGVNGDILLHLNDRMIADLFIKCISKQVQFSGHLERAKAANVDMDEDEGIERDELGDGQPKAEEDIEAGQGWPRVFKLPLPPPILQQALQREDGEFAKHGRSKMRSLLLNYLYHAIGRYTVYPTAAQYGEVLNTLLAQYPFLRDRSMTGCDLLHQSIKNKMKKERLGVEEEEMVAKRVKFGRKGEKELKPTPTKLVKVKRQEKASNPESIGEDAKSIRKHIDLLKNETAKANPRLPVIKDHMARTYVHRRNLVATATTTQMVLDEYPALTIDTILCTEVETMKAIKIVVEVKHNLKALSKKIISTGIEKPKAKNFATTFLLKMETALKEDTENIEMVAALLLIPYIFNEPADFMYVSEKEEIKGPSPVIVLSGDMYDPEHISIMMDGVLITQTRDPLFAFCLLLAVYYVFDVEYPYQARHTLQFIQEFLANLDKSKDTPIPVLRLVSALM